MFWNWLFRVHPVKSRETILSTYNFVLAVQGPLNFPLSKRAAPSAFPDTPERPHHHNHHQSTKSITSDQLEKGLSKFVTKLYSSQKNWEGGRERQCPGPGEDQRLGDQDSMSQRPSASRPASRSPTEGQRIILPPVRLRDEGNGGHGMVDRPDLQQQHAQEQHLSRQTSFTSMGPSTDRSEGGSDSKSLTSSSSSRVIGVHTILNPPDAGPTNSPNIHMRDSPQLGQISRYPSLTSVSTAYGTQQTTSTSGGPDLQQTGASQARRILTPISPSLRGRPSMESVDPSRNPFGGPRDRRYTAEPSRMPVSEAPGSSVLRAAYPSSASSAIPLNRRESLAMQTSAQEPKSQSTSPSGSYSSYGLSTQTSPANVNPIGQPSNTSSYFPGSTLVQSHQPGSGPQGSQVGTEGPYRPSIASISGPSTSQPSSSYQFMTFSTSDGTYQVPVDASSASKSADEKRARNAGASARFRQRRKEKEREANTQIGKLETHNRALEEEKQQLLRQMGMMEQERDFYRGERDRFRDIAVRSTGDQDLGRGPPSPRITRSGNIERPTGSYQAPRPQEDSDRPSRRRRTDGQEYESVPAFSHTTHSSIPPGPPTYRPGQPVTTLPPLRIDSGPVSTSGPSPMSTTLPVAPYDPYPGRGWQGMPPQSDRERR